jgi:ATP-dependent protease ClpP protease subunit/Zn ribbon nucleic-acid-binding protein
MGIFAEYLDKGMSVPELQAERKRQLSRIAALRQRDVLVYAADLGKGDAPIMITYDDLLPFTDQLWNLSGSAIDVILETPGGYAEVAEDMVRLLRDKYDDVAFIVPGRAMSAGTIMAMSGDDILLEPGSSLGPIDAQLTFQGKTFSAEAFLKGIDAIKDEVNRTGNLNRAYIPILQNISPGDIQHAQNGLAFSKELVTRWLAQYKFKPWMTHSSTGAAVTEADREARARDIAEQLCDHSRWLSHGRSIKLEDLAAMRLKVTDYSQSSELYDAIRRYHILLQMTFESDLYKVFETPNSQLYRARQVQQVAQPLSMGAKVIAGVECAKCHTQHKVQMNLEPGVSIEDGCVRYPEDDNLGCSNCGQVMNLAMIRRQVEMQTKREVVLNG